MLNVCDRASTRGEGSGMPNDGLYEQNVFKSDCQSWKEVYSHVAKFVAESLQSATFLPNFPNSDKL